MARVMAAPGSLPRAMLVAAVVVVLVPLVSGAAALSALYSNNAYQCAADRCTRSAELCTSQTGCNAVLACRQTCYDSYPFSTAKLSLVNCLESCPALADSTGSALYEQYEECYTNLCQDVVDYELCAGYTTEQVCETQEGCTFRPNQAEPCVFGDFQPPEFTACEVGISRSTRDSTATQAVTWKTMEAEDDKGGVVKVEQIDGPASGSEFPIGTTHIRYRATDESGNVAFCNFTVTVHDDTAPMLVNCPSSRIVRPNINDINYDENLVPLVNVVWIPPTVDDNDAAQLVTPSPEISEANLTAGTHTFEYKAQDNAGNTDTCTFDIVLEPAPSTFFQRFLRSTLDHSQPIATFPLQVNLDACAVRCLAEPDCRAFVTDRLGVGLCMLLRENTTTAARAPEFSRNLYQRQPFSAFECAYSAVAACEPLQDLSQSTCADDIVAFATCAEPFLQACRDPQFVQRVRASIATANNTCFDVTVPETLPPTTPFACSSDSGSVTSFETCYACCTDAFEDALEECQGLSELLQECMSKRKALSDTCISNCFDDFTSTSAPSGDVPSGFVDVFLPLTLPDVPHANLTASLRADIFLSAVSAFEFESSNLVLETFLVEDGSTLVTLSIRLPSSYTVPEVDLDQVLSRRRRNAVQAAELASLLQDSSVLGALVARFRYIFNTQTGFSTAVGVTTDFSIDVAADSKSLLTTTTTTTTASSGPTASTATGTTTSTSTSSTAFIPRFSGSSDEETTSTSVVIVGVVGTLLFVIFILVLVKTIKRKKGHDRRRSSWVKPTNTQVASARPSQSQAAASSPRHVRGGYFGPGIALPDIGSHQQQRGSEALKAVSPTGSRTNTPQRNAAQGTPKRGVSRPQPPAALPSLAGPKRPVPSDPFARTPAQQPLPPSPSASTQASPKSKAADTGSSLANGSTDSGALGESDA